MEVRHIYQESISPGYSFCYSASLHVAWQRQIQPSKLLNLRRMYIFPQIHSKQFCSQGITFESNCPLIYYFSWVDGLWKRVTSFSYCFPESVIQNLLRGERMVHKHYFPGGKWLLTVKKSSEQSFRINVFAHQWLTEKPLYVCVCAKDVNLLNETSSLETVCQID